jgi:hypothetical protein
MLPTAPAESASLADILAIEQRTWRTPGAKVEAILGRLGMTETRYYQLLNEMIDTPEALKSAPALVNRLRERRARRLARRTGQDGL